MGVLKQLKEELYEIAKRKLALEQEMKSINFYISVLKKELDQRTPVIQ